MRRLRRGLRAVTCLPLAGVLLAMTGVAAGQDPTMDLAQDEEDEAEPAPEEPVAPPPPLPSNTPAPRLGRLPVLTRDGMIRLPGGRFTMGSADPKAPPNERPTHMMNVAPFWIDRTEVTVGAYRACVDHENCTRPAKSSASCTYDLGDPNLPVSCVRWSEADTYCRAVGKRLPGEAEWEFAARGTSRSRYPWGGGATGCGIAATLVSDTTGRSCARAGRPWKVGSRPGNGSPFGVLDMTGNVEEWTADWYAESVAEGVGPRAGASHVLRGGGWLTWPSLSRTTSRNWGSALEAGPNVGMRCARDEAG